MRGNGTFELNLSVAAKNLHRSAQQNRDRRANDVRAFFRKARVPARRTAQFAFFFYEKDFRHLCGDDFVNADVRVVLAMSVKAVVVLLALVFEDKNFFVAERIFHSDIDFRAADIRRSHADFFAVAHEQNFVDGDFRALLFFQFVELKKRAFFGLVLPALIFEKNVHN